MEEVTSHLYYYCVDGSVLVESKELHMEQNWHLLEKAMCICETEQNFLPKLKVHSWECGESGYSYSQVGRYGMVWNSMWILPYISFSILSEK